MDVTLIRWFAGILLFLGFAVVALTHLGFIVTVLLFRKRVPSFVPLVGGPMGAFSFLVLPVSGLAAYWWIPLIADWGCVPSVVWYVYRSVLGSKKDDGE
jgi:hypothetical protein